jgi:hypothetical protein
MTVDYFVRVFREGALIGHVGGDQFIVESVNLNGYRATIKNTTTGISWTMRSASYSDHEWFAVERPVIKARKLAL